MMKVELMVMLVVETVDYIISSNFYITVLRVLNVIHMTGLNN